MVLGKQTNPEERRIYIFISLFILTLVQMLNRLQSLILFFIEINSTLHPSGV